MYIGRYTDKLLEENRQLKKKIATYESDTALAQMKALCDKRVQGAADREKRNYDNWMKALEVNKELKKKNTSLWQEKEKYLWELKSLRRRNEILEENNEHNKSWTRRNCRNSRGIRYQTGSRMILFFSYILYGGGRSRWLSGHS